MEELPEANPPQSFESIDRVTEARKCLLRVKSHLSESRNLRTDLKAGITRSVERLYHLVKEASAATLPSEGAEIEEQEASEAVTPPLIPPQINSLLASLTEHSALVKRSNEEMESLRQAMERQKDHLEKTTTSAEECQQLTRHLTDALKQTPQNTAGQTPSYAEIAATPRQQIREPLHSVVVSSTDDQDTGEEVLEKLRVVVDARNKGTRVERLRKAKDQKVIVSFKTKEELTVVKDRIRESGKLLVEDIKNKDPLVVVREVLSCHTNEEFIQALKKQNTHLLGNITAEDLRMGVKYRRRTRNPHMCNIVLQVSPAVWQSLTVAGRVHIDLQRVRVQDQSPLVQCTRCLCYGHSRKLCTEPADLCVHCGDAHLRADCPLRLAAATPTCHNCKLAKLDKADHTAFDSECPIRVKWDALARLSVAYC